ncbi:hypothetical protein FQN60_002171 [Etheostoma spectabile]|uniref:Uncharacterized protein n=2 Tax=Etheostoma spectabile TaxID=54343 RepID=A0A5J5D945_9PERO|nr:hypothetical protein FQN60_002171 [Etheostoma spectabile]
MLRPSREEPDVSRNVAMEKTERSNVGAEKESEAGECEVPQAAVEKADWQAPSLERQTSFGEFKYYSARSEDSFHMEDAELPQRLVSSQSATSIARRQSTADSEEDPGERTPLIKTGDNGFAPISSPPLFPSGLPIWKTGPSVSPTSSASPSSWPGSSPDSPPKPPSPSTTSGSEALLRTVPKVLTNSAQVLSSTGINSPTTPTVKTSVASPNHALSRSLLASPILSFGRGPSLSGGRSSYNSLPSPGNKSPSTTANTPSSSKAETTSIKPCSLPPPQEFGKGNPFMLFLCLSILLEHRDHIIKNGLDYNELAMHFDRLVRRHN